jgi:hypothetical protein
MPIRGRVMRGPQRSEHAGGILEPDLYIVRINSSRAARGSMPAATSTGNFVNAEDVAAVHRGRFVGAAAIALLAMWRCFA